MSWGALKTTAINWVLGVLLAFVFLLLSAYLDGKPSETDAVRATDLSVMDAVVSELKDQQ